jgi:hypothetical protein
MANPTNYYQDGRPLVIGRAFNATKLLTPGQGTLPAGTVLGVVTATGALSVCGIGNGDGSEAARYVLTREVEVDPAIPTSAEVLKAGEVNGDLLSFSGVETLDSMVVATGLTHDESLKANGIIAIRGTDLELYDNT